MNDLISTLLFIIVGVFTGSLSGLLGIGGGVLFVPTLIFLLPFTGLETSVISYVALSTSLFAGSFSSSGAAFNHYRINNIDIKAALLLSLGSCTSSIIFPKYVVQVYPGTLRIILIIILLFVALNLFFQKSNKTASSYKVHEFTLPLFGVLTGIVSVFTGLGGGVIFVPVLYYLFKTDIKKAIGTSSLVVAFTMISSSIVFAQIDANFSEKFYLGYINIGVGLALGLGALVGSFIGVRFFNRVKAIYIKRIFSVFLFLVILLMLMK